MDEDTKEQEALPIPISPADIEPEDKKIAAYLQAQSLIENPDFLSLSSEQAIKQIHRIATSSIDWDRLRQAAPSAESKSRAATSRSFISGEYRDVIRARIGDTGLAYLAPEYVSRSMAELGKTLDRIIQNCSNDPEDLTPYLLASWAYLKLVSIHPFVDGNGRVGELLMDWIRKKTGRDTIQINHNVGKIKAAFDNCANNPVIQNLQKQPQDFIRELMEANPETMVEDRGTVEFTLALLE